MPGPAAPGALLAGARYRVIRGIGEGGMGVVYEAEDTERGGLVAIKAIKNQDVDAIYRLKREFRSLADLSHTNLVGFYDMVVEPGASFIAMELVEGVDVVRYCRPFADPSEAHQPARSPSRADTMQAADDAVHAFGSLDTGPQSKLTGDADQEPGDRPAAYDEGRVRAVLPQLARGLVALHEAGKVHRDIKPSNVLVTHSGRVVLLDFGLVADLPVSGLDASDSMTGKIVGTVAYMAPEIMDAREVTPAMDLYGVGALLYEILAGQMPFSGSLMETLEAKATRVPRAPRAIVGEVPQDLNDLCMALLERDPSRRLTGFDLLSRLGAGEAGSAVGARRKRLTVPSGEYVLPATQLVGRDDELVRMHELAERTLVGGRVALSLTGESGIGKTALLDKFAADLSGRHSSMMVLRGRCVQNEAVSFKALDQVIDQLARKLFGLVSVEREQLVPGAADPLARLFPMLGRALDVPGTQRAVDAQAARREATGALRELLRRLAVTYGLAVLIDDMQWADLDSLKLLASLLSPPDPPPMMVVLCARTELDGGGALDGSLQAMAGHLESLELSPLSDAATLALATQLWPDHGDDHRRELAAQSGGVPIFLTEWAQRVGAPEPGGGTAAGEVGLDELVRRRIDQLAENARELLEVAAVSGGPISRRIAAAALACSPEVVARAARELRTARMIRSPLSGKHLLECYHSRIADTVDGALDAGRRRQLHRQLAVAYAASGEQEDERLAVHWREAGEMALAADSARRAGERAAARFEFERAARLYGQALVCGGYDEREQLSLRTALAEALADAGRPREAADQFLYCRTLAGEVGGSGAADHTYRAAVELLRAGDVRRGIELVDEVMDELGVRHARSSGQALAASELRRTWLNARDGKFESRDAAQISPRQLREIDICGGLANVLTMIEPVRGADLHTHRLELALRCGEPSRVADALAVDAAYLTGAGDYERAELMASRAERVAAQIGDERVVPATLWARGAIYFYRDCDWRRAYSKFRAAIALLRQQNRTGSFEMQTVKFYAHMCRQNLGRLVELRDLVAADLAAAEQRGDAYSTFCLRHGLIMTALMDDHADRAADELRRGAESWTNLEDGLQAQQFIGFTAGARIALYSADDAFADRLLENLRSQRTATLVAGVGTLANDVNQLIGALLILLATERPNSREAYLDELRAHAADTAGVDRPIDPGYRAIAAAAIAAFGGDSATATAKLEEALAVFEDADMLIHVESLRRQLGRLRGGAAGKALIATADGRLMGQGVIRPDRMARVTAPGPWSELGS